MYFEAFLLYAQCRQNSWDFNEFYFPQDCQIWLKLNKTVKYSIGAQQQSFANATRAGSTMKNRAGHTLVKGRAGCYNTVPLE